MATGRRTWLSRLSRGAAAPQSHHALASSTAAMRSLRVLQGSVAGLGVGVCASVGQHSSSGAQAEGGAASDLALAGGAFLAGALVAGSLGAPRPEAAAGTSSSIVDAIGNTPLVELRSLSAATGCRILAKAVSAGATL
jgi:hypothetical protein